jgi:PAS domain S-box-containing protein
MSAIQRTVGDLPPYLTFYPAVLAAAVVGGTGPGVLATLLSVLASDLLFIEPVGSLKIGTTAQTVGMGLFFAINLGITVLADRFRMKSEASRQSEERFRTMADAMSQLAWIARADGHIFWFNRRTYEYTGATPEQLEGWAWQSLVDPQALPRVLDRWRRSIAAGEPYDMEFPLRGADGRFRPFLTRIMPLKDNEGRVALWFGTNTDVSDQHQAREALRQSEDRFRALIEQAPIPIGIARNEFVLYVNQKFLETFGSRNAEDYVGRPILEHWAPESQALIAQCIRERSLGSRALATFEAVAQRKDGSRFPAHFVTTLADLSDGPATLAFITDITERKRLQDHLEEVVQERTAKLHDALGELEHMSYSMVHDMRAPLRAMQSFASMLQEECAACQQPPARDYLQRIRDSSNRLDRLITDALSYNKVVRENLPLTPVPLAELLRGMVKSYPNLHPPAVDITIDLAELVVLGNESLLTQCFGNLLDNAVKFVAPGVHPRVRVWAKSSTLNSPSSEAQPAKEGQPSTLIFVEDNGIGIPKDAQEKIFRMFQRMHHESEYPGTGIGLAIARKAVERMGGRICLDSEPGKGSRFCVELPTPSPAQAVELQHAA